MFNEIDETSVTCYIIRSSFRFWFWKRFLTADDVLPPLLVNETDVNESVNELLNKLANELDV